MTSDEAVTAYLALGSNLGTDAEKRSVMEKAAEEMENRAAGRLRLTGASSLYRTAAWGVEDQPDFLNAVVRVETTLSPQELLRLAKETEVRLGRVPTYRWGPRLIDIDLLLMNGVTLTSPELVLPHPQMLKRAFVLVPLLELDPEVKLPDGRFVSDAAEAGTEGVKRAFSFSPSK